MIYIIRIRDAVPQLMKIGYSKSSSYQRIRKLQTGCPYHLDLIQVRDGGEKEEKELHARLAKHHFRGEWYFVNAKTMDALDLSLDPAPLRKKALLELDKKQAMSYHTHSKPYPVGNFNFKERLQR